MLTQQERDFIRYWENNRLRRKKVMRQFLVGIPVGLLFVIPIVINFTSGWYKRAMMEAGSQDFNPMVLLVALLLIVGFTAIFYQRHQWDQYEQRYRELLARKEPTQSLPVPPPAEGGAGPAANDAAEVGARQGDAAGATTQAAETAPDADLSGKPVEN